jgi:hypothetical protein
MPLLLSCVDFSAPLTPLAITDVSVGAALLFRLGEVQPMAKYIFSNGKVTVVEGSSECFCNRDRSVRGVLILARDVLAQSKPEPTEDTTQDKETDNDEGQQE